MRKEIGLSIILLFAFYQAHSQDTNVWSLNKCIKYAIENNLQIKQQEIAVQQAKNNITQAKMAFLPTLSGSMNHGMNWGRSVNLQDLEIVKNKLSQSTSANLSASLNIFDGFVKHNSLKSEKKSLEINIQNVEKQKNDISISIAQAYLQILLSEKILETASESYKSIEAQVERTKKLVDAGSQAYSTLLEVQAQLGTEKVQLVAAENDVRTNYIALKQLLDLRNSETFNIITPNLSNLISYFDGRDIESIYSKSLGLPQIKSAEISLEKSRIDYKIQKGRAYPSVSFSAGYGTYYSDNSQAAFFRQFNDNKNPSVSFGLSIPILNGWQSNTAIRNARLNVKNAEIELKIKHQTLYKEIQQAFNNALSSYEKMRASEQTMKSSQESFDYVEKKFSVGLLNGTDYTVSKANLFKAKSDYYQSVYQYIFQTKILDFYTGTPITL
jgi:outer membrane protein